MMMSRVAIVVAAYLTLSVGALRYSQRDGNPDDVIRRPSRTDGGSRPSTRTGSRPNGDSVARANSRTDSRDWSTKRNGRGSENFEKMKLYSSGQPQCNRMMCGALISEPYTACDRMPISCGDCRECLFARRAGFKAKPAVKPYMNFDESPETIPERPIGRIGGGWTHIQHSVPPATVPSEPKCTGHTWTFTGKPVGKGANGRVQQVTFWPTTQAQNVYALKEALTPAGQEDIIWENYVMKNTHCANVLRAVDQAPCIHSFGQGDTILKAAYVSPLMRGSLWDWIDGKDATQIETGRPSREMRVACGRNIYSELVSALNCFHSENKGFMHGDLKGDNIYYAAIDDRGCPSGLKLADFGLADRMGAARQKFGKTYYGSSVHLPGSVFEEASDPLGITARSNPSSFIASPEVDWCSFVFMMRTDYGIAAGSGLLPAGSADAECGMMGTNRATYIRVLA